MAYPRTAVRSIREANIRRREQIKIRQQTRDQARLNELIKKRTQWAEQRRKEIPQEERFLRETQQRSKAKLTEWESTTKSMAGQHAPDFWKQENARRQAWRDAEAARIKSFQSTRTGRIQSGESIKKEILGISSRYGDVEIITAVKDVLSEQDTAVTQTAAYYRAKEEQTLSGWIQTRLASAYAARQKAKEPSTKELTAKQIVKQASRSELESLAKLGGTKGFHARKRLEELKEKTKTVREQIQERYELQTGMSIHPKILEESIAKEKAEALRSEKGIEYTYQKAGPLEMVGLHAHALLSPLSYEYITSYLPLPSVKKTTPEQVVKKEMKRLYVETRGLTAGQVAMKGAYESIYSAPVQLELLALGGYGITKIAALSPKVAAIMSKPAVKGITYAMGGVYVASRGAEIGIHVKRKEYQQAGGVVLRTGLEIGAMGVGAKLAQPYKTQLMQEVKKLPPKKQAEFMKKWEYAETISKYQPEVKEISFKGMERIPIKARPSITKFLVQKREAITGGTFGMRTQLKKGADVIPSDIDVYVPKTAKKYAAELAGMLKKAGVKRVSVPPKHPYEITIRGKKAIEFHLIKEKLYPNIEQVKGILRPIKMEFVKTPKGIKVMRIGIQAKRKLVGAYLQPERAVKDIPHFEKILKSQYKVAVSRAKESFISSYRLAKLRQAKAKYYDPFLRTRKGMVRIGVSISKAEVAPKIKLAKIRSEVRITYPEYPKYHKYPTPVIPKSIRYPTYKKPSKYPKITIPIAAYPYRKVPPKKPSKYPTKLKYPKIILPLIPKYPKGKAPKYLTPTKKPPIRLPPKHPVYPSHPRVTPITKPKIGKLPRLDIEEKIKKRKRKTRRRYKYVHSLTALSLPETIKVAPKGRLTGLEVRLRVGKPKRIKTRKIPSKKLKVKISL